MNEKHKKAKSKRYMKAVSKAADVLEVYEELASRKSRFDPIDEFDKAMAWVDKFQREKGAIVGYTDEEIKELSGSKSS